MIGIEHMGVTEEQLNGLGNRWAKRDGEVRWYVNDWMDAIGMEVVYYNTGNISDVYYHGGPASHGEDHPSNYWFKKSVAGTKVWIDAEGRVHVDYCKDAGVERDIVAKVGERIEALLAPAPVEAVVEVCARAEAQAPVEEAEIEPEDGWSEELADQRASEQRMVVRRADGIVAQVRRVLEPEDLDRYDAEELDELAPRTQYGVQWDTSEVFAWLREGQARSVAHVEREDGEVASLQMSYVDEGEDIWTAIGRIYPKSCDLMDEASLLPDDRQWSADEHFCTGEDSELAMWLAKGVQHYSGALDESDATIEADRREGVATVTWAADGLVLSQDIDLNEGDMERIVLGADPVAEGWEDGLGRAVCAENASGDVPEGMWADVMAGASWEPWDQGDSYDEQVQPGTWKGRRVEAVYRIPDPEAFEAALREDEDGAYLDALKSLRVVGWSE